MYDVIVVGAGICGLAAARQLCSEGHRVLVLEARNRAGGRIYTFNEKGLLLEAGAEFIHGEQPHTLQLLEEAGLKYDKIEGSIYRFEDGELSRERHFIENEKALEKKLKEVKKDIVFEKFLKQNLKGKEFTKLRESVKRFIEGYDAADASRASTLAFRDEWMESDEKKQFRPQDGYGKLVEFLAKDLKKKGGRILLSTPVTRIVHRKGHAKVFANGRVYEASRVIVTVPPPVLLSSGRKVGKITFSPALKSHMKAFSKLGFGSVIKVTLRFKRAFWKKSAADFSFVFSDQLYPTWWRHDSEKPVITGWLAGPEALKRSGFPDKRIVNESLASVATIFGLTESELKKLLVKGYVWNWGSMPYSMAAYSYAVVDGMRYREIIRKPVNETIYFAGEALMDSDSGTVEAAIASGMLTVFRMSLPVS